MDGYLYLVSMMWIGEDAADMDHSGLKNPECGAHQPTGVNHVQCDYFLQISLYL